MHYERVDRYNKIIVNYRLQDKTEIVGTAWIELNISGTHNHFEHWCNSSKYLSEEAYQLYVPLFQKHSPDLNYYGPSKFVDQQLINLKDTFVDYHKRLKQSEVQKELITLNEELIALTNKCICERRVLWILGL